jgi:hypothetical protein
MWIMDDDSFNKLIAITEAHLRLDKEHGDNVLPERRQAIRVEIDRLRVERECLLEPFPGG